MPQEPLAQVLKLTLEFDGAGYRGWQSQPDRRTIQDELEQAVARVNGAPVSVHGCGRTDAGVSARNYVADFTPARHLPFERWLRALNYHLPPDICVKAVEPAPAGFHARFSARRKHYHYRIVRGRSPLRHPRAWELRGPVDVERVRRAAAEFTGRRDFRAFCQVREVVAAGRIAPDALSAERQAGTCAVERIAVSAAADELELRVIGDRFLYKMVRRIVGAAITYGAGRMTLADIRAALAGRPHRAFRTAPAHGLLLDRVEY